MKYKEVPEPHRKLLFTLVEVYREHAESSTGLIPFIDELGTGLILYPEGKAEQKPGPYTRENLRFLESNGYLTYRMPSDHIPCIALTPQAFDYYDYMHSSALWRFIIDVWDKTEKYWLALLFGLIGGALPGLVGRLIKWLGSLLR